MMEALILAFDGKSTYTFVRHDRRASSIFGGPNEGKLVGKKFPKAQLHQIARISGGDIPIVSDKNVFHLPLHYGLRHGGGGLTYQFENDDISILEMDQKLPSDDFPYKNYPTLLPFVPLTVSTKKKQSWRQFASQFPNMPDDQPSDIIVIVPPAMTLGVSMWGYWGDAEGVSIVFECDIERKRVKAYNVCT